MRLYDTARQRSGAVRAARARADVHVRDHPVRRHPPRPCGDVPRLRRAAAPADRPRPPRDLRPQRHRRRRSVVRQGSRARRALPRPGGRGGGPFRGGHGGAQRTARWRRGRGRRRRSPTSAGSSAWSSTVASPTRPAAACSSTCPSSNASAPSATTPASRCSSSPANAAATSTTRSSAIRSTSSCGSRRHPTSRRGTRCGGPAGLGGTSSAAPSPCASWARRSTSTAVAPISSTPTTSASGPSPRRRPASRSSSTGCTRR